MSRGQGAPANLIIGLLVANLTYLLFTVVLAMILNVSPGDIFTGPFSESANSLVSAWVTVGALLGVTDVLAVLSFVSSVLSGGR